VWLIVACVLIGCAPVASAAAFMAPEPDLSPPPWSAARDVPQPPAPTERPVTPGAGPTSASSTPSPRLPAPAAPALETPAVRRAAAPSPSPTSHPDAQPGAYGCAAALAYLAAHAAPGYTLECPGNAYGNQAMTCLDHAPQCGGRAIIAIAVPCAAAYMNEAHNSWIVAGLRSGSIDPYGYCH
jgi:hypothetical protein